MEKNVDEDEDVNVVFINVKVRIKRTYTRKIGPRKERKRKQKGSGYVNSEDLMHGLNLPKKGANTEFDKIVINDVISLLPNAYKSIKNRALDVKKRN